MNKSGNVYFAAPVIGGAAPAALLLYAPDGIKPIVADGDFGPPETAASFVLSRGDPTQHRAAPVIEYTINDLGTVTFTSGLSTGPYLPMGLFQFAGGTIRTLVVLGDAVPATQNSSFANNLSGQTCGVFGGRDAFCSKPFLQNDRGDVAFLSALCCENFPEGAFLSPAPALQISNGDFELPGGNGVPSNWQTVWTNSGSGEAFQYDSNGSDSMTGTSVLRLHVDPGGGSIFVLSDAMPVQADTIYTVSSWMRYSLGYPNDGVFFSILQFDASGNVVGFNEVSGISGENYWHWEPKRLLIHTTPVTNSIEIRFGLMSADESYLDVDDVQ